MAAATPTNRRRSPRRCPRRRRRPPETPAKNQAYLKAKPGDVIKVRIEELNPTQAAIGYDQIYYKLGRWQGDFARPTWAGDTANQIDYLNRTVGKKFDDYCEDTGAGKRAQPFASIAQAQAARLDKPETFSCLNAPGADATALKTVVVGWDGKLYLTDGHHSFGAARDLRRRAQAAGVGQGRRQL